MFSANKERLFVGQVRMEGTLVADAWRFLSACREIHSLEVLFFCYIQKKLGNLSVALDEHILSVLFFYLNQ